MRIHIEILVAGAILCISVSPVIAGLTEFKDGRVHDIDYGIAWEVQVDYRSPGKGTTVNILEGANIISATGLKAFEDSTINVLGGSRFV